MVYAREVIVDIFRYCPVPQTVTSTYRLGPPYHGTHEAVDFASIYGTMPRLQADVMMRDAAKWWYQFSTKLLELIHTTPFNTDNGFYVKNGQRVGPGFYGAREEQSHLDHTHVAMRLSAAQTVLGGLRSKYGAPGKKRIYRADGTYYYPTTTQAAVYHTVKSGESLSYLAKRYGTSVDAIQRLNPSIKDVNLIQVGQKIRVK
jgi:predicted phosphohydrolase